MPVSMPRIMAGAGLACLLLASRSVAAEAPAVRDSAGPAPDLKVLLEKVREVQLRDLEAWSEYQFRRIVIRERLDEAGEVRERERWEFDVTPQADGFDERMILIDGNEPTERDVRHHRKRAKFNQQYARAVAGQAGPEEEGGFSVRQMLLMPSYEYRGIEERNGRRCHVLTFDPHPEAEAEGLADRFTQAMGGTLWITEEGLHLYEADASTASSLPLALGLAKVRDLRLRFEARPVEPGVWLPRRVEVDSKGRILLSPFHKRNVQLYRDYQRVIR